MTGPSRELLGVRAFATKVDDYVISGDPNCGILDWIQLEVTSSVLDRPSRPVFASERRATMIYYCAAIEEPPVARSVALPSDSICSFDFPRYGFRENGILL